MVPRSVIALQQSHAPNCDPNSWMKRSFYIIETNGVPKEVYCTDLMHRARQRRRLADGHQLPRVVDKWREEWTQGVQVPLGSTKEIFTFENTALFPELANNKLECFQLPSKLISRDKSTNGRKRQRTDQSGEECNQILQRKLSTQFEELRRLRLNSEKVRSLCYLVTKREKLKKLSLEQFEQQVKQTADKTFGLVTAMSSRRWEQLLSEWREAINFNVKSGAETRNEK
uniref:Uncharacterized protein n=1 Tax=Globodera rostochiensis TaxID=31243 RepID=A0A914H0Q9_GLORO